MLKDIWPSSHEIQEVITASVSSDMFQSSYASVFKGDERWNSIESPVGEMFDWQDDSTYIQNPPYFPRHDARSARTGGHTRRPLPCPAG